VSAPERHPVALGVTLARCTADVVELAALRGRREALERAIAARGVALPALGRLAMGGGTLVLCVRPERYLLISAPAAPGESAASWQAVCDGHGAAVDQSSGLAVFELAGAGAREVLARGWRLDLDPRTFPVGCAAASLMAQVSVTLAALPSSLLLLTPASYARHLREWLALSARSVGLAVRPEVSIAVVLGESPR